MLCAGVRAWHASCTAYSRHIAKGCFQFNDACKNFSSATPNVADQMIDYALQQCKGKHEQAVDILRSGLSMHPDSKGHDAAKLLVALAEVESDRSNWTAALDAAGRAESALKGTGVQQGAAAATRLHAGAASVRALLVTGNDSEALAAADATVSDIEPASASPSPLGLRALALALTTRHATASWDGASKAAEQLAALVAGGSGSACPDALLALAHWQVKQGDVVGAAANYQQAADAAAAIRGGAAGAAGGWAAYSEAWSYEMEAGALVGSGQLALAAKEWSQAEEVLGKALSAAEKVSADNHPRVVPVLALLSYAYCRTARFTFAEGLLRECGKILKLDPGRYVPAGTAASAPTHAPLHASLVAHAAWRHSQLLHVMPRRENEATAWEKAAREAWAHAGPVAQPVSSSQASSSEGACDGSIESVLGGTQHLKGQGPVGRGLIVDVFMRRALSL